MSVPRIVGTDFGGPDGAGLLVLGPSLGTSAATLWEPRPRRLDENFRVVAWDLPGHGHSPAVGAVHDRRAGRRRCSALADDFAPGNGSTTQAIRSAARSACSCCSTRPTGSRRRPCCAPGAEIGSPRSWRERAATVRAAGAGRRRGAAQRWFSPGFLDRRARGGAALLAALRDTDPESYAQVCEALAAFDVADRLPEITTPVAGDRRRRRRADPAGGPAPHRRRRQRRPARRARRRRTLAPPRRPSASHAIAEQRSSRRGRQRRAYMPRAWRCGARCSATPTWTAPSPRPPTSPRTSRS